MSLVNWGYRQTAPGAAAPGQGIGTGHVQQSLGWHSSQLAHPVEPGAPALGHAHRGIAPAVGNSPERADDQQKAGSGGSRPVQRRTRPGNSLQSLEWPHRLLGTARAGGSRDGLGRWNFRPFSRVGATHRPPSSEAEFHQRVHWWITGAVCLYPWDRNSHPIGWLSGAIKRIQPSSTGNPQRKKYP